ncbi:MAG: hypothetical protein RMM17_07085 [Acidobacteriota bacterium]|nr:hypothetical protein [Blastocatellia bacterium]MDW8412428.1 hypothetical protein [Acidobacteriota bacterium]
MQHQGNLEIALTLEILEKIGIERATAIWKWLVDPEGNPVPEGLKGEEVMGIYLRNTKLLERLREIVASLESLRGGIANKPQLNKGPMRI